MLRLRLLLGGRAGALCAGTQASRGNASALQQHCSSCSTNGRSVRRPARSAALRALPAARDLEEGREEHISMCRICRRQQ